MRFKATYCCVAVATATKDSNKLDTQVERVTELVLLKSDQEREAETIAEVMPLFDFARVSSQLVHSDHPQMLWNEFAHTEAPTN